MNTHDEPVKLYSNNQEKQYVDDCATLYAMLKVMQSLEDAYSRDLVDADEYEKACQRLISQKRTLVDGDFRDKVGDLRAFAASFNLVADKAIRRFDKGLAATLESSLPSGKASHAGSVLISVTQDIIELKDALFMDMLEVEVISPLLRRIIGRLCKLPDINPDTPELVKLREWQTVLTKMLAHETLDENQKKQMSHDIGSMLDCLKENVKG